MAKRKGAGGPKTDEGKAIASRNAVTHGIMALTPVVLDYETDDEWAAHRAGVVDGLAPVGTLEGSLGRSPDPRQRDCAD